MLDGRLKALLDPLSEAIARPLVAANIGANAVTLAGCAVSALAGVAIAFGAFWLALTLFLAGRVLDGLDGAVARLTRKTDFGGYLDILCDFVAYAAIPVGFAIADTANAVPAIVLLATFYVNGASFLAYAIFAAKRGETSRYAGPKSLYYSAGLMEGSETIIVFVIMLFVPAWFPVIAYVFAAACVATTVARVLLFRATYGREDGA
jgi:phosphatidylglycerophosphate synthase